MLKTQIPLTWTNWIQENLAKGCTLDSIAMVMVNNGFAPEVATQAIRAMQQQRSGPVNFTVEKRTNKGISQATNNSGYTYEKPRVPFDVNYIDTSDRRVYIGMRVEKPTIMTFDNLLSYEEVDKLIELSRHKLTESKVVDPITGKDTKINDRKSEGTFFNVEEDEFIAKLDRRIAEVMCQPVRNGEGLQILHYQPGGEYKAHFDYFPYEQAGSQAHIARGGQRVSTLIIYLSEVEQGGETTFPDVGVSVIPKKGSAVYFEYCNSKGEIDPLTLHAGNPVTKGEKWIATKWVRQNKYS